MRTGRVQTPTVILDGFETSAKLASTRQSLGGRVLFIDNCFKKNPVIEEVGDLVQKTRFII